MISPLIEVSNVSKTYRSKTKGKGLRERLDNLFRPKYTSSKVIENVSFTLYQGQSLAILGPNGAGKSTLIKILSGIQRTDEGSVRVLAMDPYEKKKKLFTNLGVVFGHKNCLWWDLPLYRSLEMVQPLYGLERATFHRELAEISKLLNINNIMDKPVRLLSLGERVKSELAFNLSFRPKILFLDEPTIGLDISSKYEIRELLKALKQERGVSYIITSHDMGDIDGYVDDIILLHKGKEQFYGNIDELKNRIPSMVTITLFCENLMTPAAAAKRVDEIAIKASVLLQGKLIKDDEIAIDISLSREACPRFIQAMTAELSCAFSVSTPSLEEMLRVKFKEFN